MKKFIILLIFATVLFLQPIQLFAKTMCFAGGGAANGTYFYLSGGKINQKPFSGNWVKPGFCNVPAWASIVTDASGNYYISINTVHDPVTGCTSVWFIATGVTLLSMLGEFDNEQDGTIENTFTMAQVNCSTIPPAINDDTDAQK